MEEENLNKKIIRATKWSIITELIAKLIIPITNMFLARILAPEAFGVVATVTMIISFADMFTDAGFQKYLIQHEFISDEEKNKYANVAFWTNLMISLVLWAGVIIFSTPLATMVGSPGLESVLVVACIQLPLTSFSSIQMAIYRRDFDFKTLFTVRVVGVFIPFLITIPLAILGYSYWSLIIGNIFGGFFNAIALTIKSKWKPKLYFDFFILKKMLSFSIWSLIEAISIWMTAWIDTFIIGSVLDSYYLGIYKTSIATVNTVFGLITGSTTPVLFSALSRVQEDKKEFERIFYDTQKLITYLVLPMSIGMFIYRDFMVKILLGDSWTEAGQVIGIWALSSGIVIVLGHYASEVYRAKGKPKLSFVAQMLHLIVLVPVCIITSQYGFNVLVIARSLIRLQMVLVHLILIKFIMKMSIMKSLNNLIIPSICSLLMALVGISLRNVSSGLIWNISSIFLCMIVYVMSILIFPSIRKEILDLIRKLNIKYQFGVIPKK